MTQKKKRDKRPPKAQRATLFHDGVEYEIDRREYKPNPCGGTARHYVELPDGKGFLVITGWTRHGLTHAYVSVEDAENPREWAKIITPLVLA